MLKGIFKICPSLPKYAVTYDLISFLSTWIYYLQTTYYLWIFLLKNYVLCSSLEVDRSALAHGTYTFYINTIEKTTRPGRHQPHLVYQSFEPNEKLCIINYLYRLHTDLLKENLEGTPQQRILSYAYPHKSLNLQTIARYVKLFLGMCGNGITIFTAHSTQGASALTANNMGLSIKDSKKVMGWSEDSTFCKYYN